MSTIRELHCELCKKKFETKDLRTRSFCSRACFLKKAKGPQVIYKKEKA